MPLVGVGEIDNEGGILPKVGVDHGFMDEETKIKKINI